MDRGPGQNETACIFDEIENFQITRFMGLTWVLSMPDGPHIGPMKPCYQGVHERTITLVCNSWLMGWHWVVPDIYHWNIVITMTPLEEAHEEVICLLFTKLIHFLHLTNIFYMHFTGINITHNSIAPRAWRLYLSCFSFVCSLQDPHFKGNRFSCLLLSVQSTWFVPGEMWNWMWLSPGWSCTQQLVGWSLKLIRRTWYDSSFWHISIQWYCFFQYRQSQCGDKVATTPSVSL